MFKNQDANKKNVTSDGLWHKLSGYLSPQFYYSRWVFLAALLLCCCLSALARYNQYHQWQKTPELYFVDGKPMMTTMDAFLWLRFARQYKTDSYDNTSIDTMRIYPLGYTKPKVILLSYLLAKLSVLFDHIEENATLVIPILASLFIIPFFIYFLEIGYPTAAVVGSLVGTFNHIYMIRTAIGRLDTDSLNLFFLFLVSYFILLTFKDNKERNLYLYSAMAGISMFAFHTWYHLKMLSEFYLFVLVLYLVANRVPWRKILKSAVIFVLFSADDNVVNIMRALLAELSKVAPGTHSAYMPLIFIVSLYLSEAIEIMDSWSMTLFDYLSAYTEKTLKFSLTGTNFIFSMSYIISMLILHRVGFNITAICLLFVVYCLYLERYDRLMLFKMAAVSSFVIALPTVFYATKDMIGNIYNSYVLYYVREVQYNITTGLMVKQSVFSTVEEMQKIPVEVLMSSIFKNSALSVIGVFFFAIFSITHIKKLIPLLPLIIMGLLTFNGSNRYVMNLAPLVGIGYGYMIAIIIKLIMDSLNTRDMVKELTVYGVSFLFFLSVLNQTAYAYVPQPSVPTSIYIPMSQLKDKLPKDSVILTWWDLGYAIVDTTGYATFHDGGTQNTSSTNYIARGLTSESQYELYNIANMLCGKGATVTEDIIKNDLGINSIIDDIKVDDIYLMYTQDMIGKFQAIYYLRGAIPQKYANQNESMIIPLLCQSFDGGVLSCGSDTIDMNKGLINNSSSFARSVFIERGKVVKQYNYENQSSLFLEVFVQDGRILELYMMKDAFFYSNLNQMFILGNYNSAIYEETLNAFPAMRVFKLRHHPLAGDSGSLTQTK
ncbi:oligosaccharyl transferase STT3 subunit [Candidatus Magnetobacterium bavaricum]|uniref:Oligosaccharyl transferase STT3 subunit n=1 Tax=Candidatus Magnetobacterium bavaricum TaxID=29290 RepID=A0A0F3GMZ6_9BACT|nr:oligosaccharyl transferase STT3 subunit [Candidatus Magnetobacterium bavaricum]